MAVQRLRRGRTDMTRTLITLLMAASLAGCATLEPAYHQPALPVPASFPQGGVYPSEQETAASANLTWETVFTDSKLQGLIKTALVQNRDLRATVANVAAAHAQFQIQHSQLFPTVTAAGQETQAHEPLSEITGVPGAVGHETIRTDTADVGVSAWEIDLFGRLRSLSKEAFEQYLATDEGRRSAQLSLVAGVANGYLTLAADRSLLQISQQTQKSSGDTLKLTQSRFEGGVASQLDVRQAQTVVEQARADAATRAITVAQDKNALDLLVGSTVAEDQLPANLDETRPSFADFSAGLKSDVLLDRPDVLQAEHTLKAANASIGAARAAFFPTISLTGSTGFASASLSDLFKSGSSFWSIGPAISVPIFDAGRNAAGLRLSKAQRDADVATYESAVQSAFRDVANALAEKGGSVEQLAAQQALVDASADALRLSTARYERGSDSYLDLLDAQRTLYSAQQQLVSAQFVQTSNLIALYRAVGGSTGN
jgi:multidrug efflux system outer membrane protein